MKPYKENLIHNGLAFPVDIFIQDNSKKNIVVYSHWHECLEILYMLEGEAIQQVNSETFKVVKDDIVILKEGDIHSTQTELSAKTRILVIKFLPEVIKNCYTTLFESKYIGTFINNGKSGVSHIMREDNNYLKIQNIIKGLYEEFSDKENGYEIFIKGYLYQLIAILTRSNIINSKSSFKDSEFQKLDKLFKYIETNYKENIDLKMAADVLNLSYFYFSRYFKKITGRTFKEYLDFVRICEAEKLILSKDINISQAAYEVGFSNVSSFNRVFKRVRNYPPSNIKKIKTAKK
ncbi:AraC family transcriptional regulator [Clostridium sediminicola]|uniref:AraC family transcriptional regulator n=1 Tax=Clostridium sediminicola TaxID=3114879 RepID=UPI0031F23A6E